MIVVLMKCLYAYSLFFYFLALLSCLYLSSTVFNLNYSGLYFLLSINNKSLTKL